MNTLNISTLKIHKLTKAQYDREAAAGNIDETALYLTPDDEIDLSTYATKEELSDKADSTHNHAISDITGLQTALDGKAASSHGTHVSYSTTAPVMDGTASVGTASTVARSDHKHPTDTTRAAKTDLDSHTANTTLHITSAERTNWNAAKTHADSAHAPSNAEKNQNAFSNVAVGSTTIAADSATDTLTLAGSNVTITPDATNDKVTIGITKDNVTSALGYTPPTTNTTYSAATTSAAGLMSASDKSKLDGISSGANAYTLPTATSSVLGGVKTGSNITNSSGTISITKDNVTSALGYTPPTTNTTYSAATTSTAGLMSASDKSKLDGITSGANAYTLPTATSSVLGGVKTGSNITNSSGTISITKDNVTSALGYTPPTTNTTYSAMTGASSSAAGTSGLVPAPASGKQSSFLRGDGTWATPTNTTYSAATTSAAGLMSASDKSKLDGIASGANAYTLPAATSSALGGVKTGSNITNSSGTISITKDNVTSALGYTPPTTNTTYSAATTSTAGLMSASDKSKLDGIASTYMTKANPTGSGYVSIGRKSSTTVGTSSVAMGNNVTASGPYSVAIGNQVTTPGESSISTGYATNASGECATAMGSITTASGKYSFSVGYNSTASGFNSNVIGYNSTASGEYCVAFGVRSTALNGQVVLGHDNNTTNATAGTTWGSSSGTAFVIGNGSGSSSTSNAFRVDYNGTPYGKSAYTTTGCDYAEYFEWQDANPENEDRRGYFVTLEGEQIKIAEPGDYILGIVSGHPAVIGNGDEDWMGRYIFDDFGAFIYEDYEYEDEEPEEVIDEETGKITIQMKTVKKTCKKYKENPDYDPSIAYIQREDRSEWDAVGMVGVLSVRDDGTCRVNGYCKVAEGGMATASDSGYRVVKRVNGNIVKVIFR